MTKVKVYDTLAKLYPELEELDNATKMEPVEEDTSKPVEKSSPNETAETQEFHLDIDGMTQQHTPLASEDIALIEERVSDFNKVINIAPYNDNSWVRHLNKIVNTLIADYKETGAAFVVTGEAHNVGSSTISYWTARLLASFDRSEHILYLVLDTKTTMPNNIIEDLETRRYFAETFIEHLSMANLNRLRINITETQEHEQATFRAIGNLVIAARKKYRWIIIDAPPLDNVPGIFTLARETEGIILIARAQKTRIPSLNSLAMTIDESGSKLLGVILNRRYYPLPKFLMKYF